MAKLLEFGYCVSVPFGNNARYDMIADVDGKLIRIQCKTGRTVNGTVSFNTCNTNLRRYDGEADVFLVLCKETSVIYCVPVKSASKNGMRLRVVKSKNCQEEGINNASGYVFKGFNKPL